MFRAQSLTVIVKWLAFGAISVDLALVIFILCRRAVRNRFYSRKDAALKRFSEIIAEYFAGKFSLERTARLLKVTGRPEREAARTLLLASIGTKTRGQATELLRALGFAEEWAEQAFGKRRAKELLQSIEQGRGFSPPLASQRNTGRLQHWRLFCISRAVAAGRLGRLAGEYSSCFMQEALRDPSPYVGRLAVASIGRNQISNGVPILLEELRRSVAGETELPIRSIKTALVRYPIEELRHFTPFLERGSPRFRFLAVDSIREICTRADSGEAGGVKLPPELHRWFLDKAVCDESADVRARSAGVIRYFRCPDAVDVLRLLLADENEFVRLHSVRACADPYYADLIGDILRLVTDERWRVREAAVRVVASFRDAGRQQLERFFLQTTDRYASEQIGDELQRSGIARQFIAALPAPGGEGIRAHKVCCKMAELGMVSLMAEELAGGGSLDLRTRLFEVLSAPETPQFTAALRRIVANGADPLKIKAEGRMRANERKAAMAAGD